MKEYPNNFMDDKLIFRRVSNKDCYEVKPDTLKWAALRYMRLFL